MKKSSFAYMLVFLLIFMVGCSSHPTMSSIAGTYKSDLMGGELTIKKDGTFYETGFNGTCEIDGSKLIMRAGTLSVVYEIQEHDGYYVFASEYVNYISVQHYDDYMSEQLKIQQEAENKRQEEKSQHQLSGQYLLCDVDQNPTCFIELFEGWSYAKSDIFQLQHETLVGDPEEKIFFSFADMTDYEMMYYNNKDIASWQYDSAAQVFVDGDGTQISGTVYWYVANNTERMPFDYDIETSTYTIGAWEFKLQADNTLAEENGARMTPTQFIYQFNL